MKFQHSERGQALIIIALIAIGVFALAALGIAGSTGKGYQDGANAIGETVGDTIDNATRDEELENLVWQAENAIAAWVGGQRNLVPNQHAVEEHGDDAWTAVRCYNKNGTFHVMKTTLDGIHMLCRDDDGSIRDVVVNQKEKNVFEMNTAYTPKDGTLREVMKYINGKLGAGKYTFPENSTILVDGQLIP